MSRDETEQSPRNERRRFAAWVDWTFVALALASVVLLIADEILSRTDALSADSRKILIQIDLGICVLFFVEFLVRLIRAERRWHFVKSHWYDIIGMIPASHPALRGFRLVRLVRIFVLGSRFVRATNRTFGAMTFEAVVRRFSDILVEIVSDAVILKNLDVLAPGLVRARFAERIGDALAKNRQQVSQLVRRSMAQHATGKRLIRMPGVRNLVDAAETAVVDSIIESLRSNELNFVIQEATQEVLDELKKQVAVREYAQQSGLRTRPP